MSLTISRPCEDVARRTWLVLDGDGDPVTRLAIGDLLRAVADRSAWAIADVDPEQQAIGVRPLANNHPSPAAIKYYRAEELLGRAWRHFPRGRICK
jgi:hypothetical protein